MLRALCGRGHSILIALSSLYCQKGHRVRSCLSACPCGIPSGAIGVRTWSLVCNPMHVHVACVLHASLSLCTMCAHVYICPTSAVVCAPVGCGSACATQCLLLRGWDLVLGWNCPPEGRELPPAHRGFLLGSVARPGSLSAGSGAIPGSLSERLGPGSARSPPAAGCQPPGA